MKRVLYTLASILVTLNVAGQQTYSWANYSTAATTYTYGITAPITNSMYVAYTEGANYRSNVFQGAGSSTCSGVSVTAPGVPYYNNVGTTYVNDYSSGSCVCNASSSQKGLVLAGNWPDNTTGSTRWEQVVISFDASVCAPVNFSLYDFNSSYYDDGSTKWSYFTDKLDISALDNSLTAVPVGNIVVGGCGTTITTSGTTKTIKANMTGGCGCAAVTVAVGAAGTYVASITLKYYPGGSTYASDPWSQFIIITNLTTSCSTVLPISLESFTGKCTGNKKVLRWVTSSETNNKYFTIEQSKNGTDFVELAKVNGKGTSLVRNTYEYSFSEENSGYNYYRLKQTDMNGVSMTFSAIYLSCIDKIGAVKLYPNPAHKSIKLEFESADEGSYEVNIVDIAGRVVRSFPFNAKQDRNEIELNIEDLSNGLYNIIIADGEGLARPQTLKFIKSNE